MTSYVQSVVLSLSGNIKKQNSKVVFILQSSGLVIKHAQPLVSTFTASMLRSFLTSIIDVFLILNT